MRLPWVQITIEFIEQAAPDVAEYLGLSNNEALGGLINVVKWGLGRCPDDKPPSEGELVEGAAAARLLRRASGLAVDPEKLVDACEQCRPALLERVEGGIRFRGFDRYDQTWARNRRKGHGLDGSDDDPRGSRGVPARENHGNAGDPARKTQTQTQTQMKTQTQKKQQPPYPPSQANGGKRKKPTRKEEKAAALNVGAQPTGACARCRAVGPITDERLCYACNSLWVAEVDRRRAAGDPAPWANCAAWIERERAGPTLRVVGSESSRVHTAADTSGVA